MNLLVTGGCGFIGSNYIAYVLRTRKDVKRLVNLDLMTYAGNPANCRDFERDLRYRFVKGDIADKDLVDSLMQERPDAVVNIAAETHVDRSLYDGLRFTHSNVLGTHVLLEAAIRYRVPKFVQVSTDEVYGSLGPQGKFTEQSPLNPSSFYSASKTAGDLLALAAFRTYGLPVVITRSCNNYGPRQHLEKFIPVCITRALRDEPIPVYGDGMNVREWLFVEDNARGIHLALESGRPGEIYNLGSGEERRNIDMVKLLLSILGKPETLIRFVKDRPGHDRRYALDVSKAERDLGFRPSLPLEVGLRITVEWYKKNTDWIKAVEASTEHRKHVERHYGA